VTTLERLREDDSFEDEVFAGLDVRGIDLGGKEFVRCTFRDGNLSEVRLRDARLEEVTFVGCDLTRMDPTDARLHGVHLTRCKVMGVPWTTSSLSPDLMFEDCNLTYASFIKIHLRGARFVRSDLSSVQFVDTDLTDAGFSNSTLAGASFENCNLTRADLSTASGVVLDPAKNRVKDARIAVDAAAALAASLGLRVAGFHEPARRR
jgi:fluoroquinolone resistance protein